MNIASFPRPQPDESVTKRFDAFIAWASPGGEAKFDAFHAPEYDADGPWFEHSSKLIPHSHASSRIWFVKQENLGQHGLFAREKGAASRATIKKPDALFGSGRFLKFSKAFLNYQYALREPRSILKHVALALVFLEGSLRELNNGQSDPIAICHVTFERANATLASSLYGAQKKRDIACELDRIAETLQDGGRVRKSAFPGLHLVAIPFAFKSNIPSAPRYGKKKKYQTTKRNTSSTTKNLTSADVSAVGICYRESLKRFGKLSLPTFVASLLGLTLTTASMRASELQSLRQNALFFDPDKPNRLRMRIARPKPGTEQIVPIARKLNELAMEFFNNAVAYSQEARDAFKFYIAQSPNDRSGIHDLYVPERLQRFFAPEFMLLSDMRSVLGQADRYVRTTPGGPSTRTFKLAKHLKFIYFVDEPGDALLDRTPRSGDVRVRLRDVVDVCAMKDIKMVASDHLDPKTFVSRRQAYQMLDCCEPVARRLLAPLFSSKAARTLEAYVSSSEFKAALLADFKSKKFPHWPYTSKDRSVRLDEALCAYFESQHDAGTDPGTAPGMWWKPGLLSMASFGVWISRRDDRDPILFSMFDVRLRSGEFPSIGIHMTRRFHHTEALRAGVNPLFANELAGRESSWQGEHYDDRSPEELLTRSIETFDPDARFRVIGPIAEDHSVHSPPIIEREIFMRHVASPKHVTWAGGCRRDWSIDPCDMHDDCTRCGQHNWQKGDVKRLPIIKSVREDAITSIKKGEAKMKANPRMESVKKHIQALKETVWRCDEIIRIEADPNIEPGTIVTFSAAPTAMSERQFEVHLRNRKMPAPTGAPRA
jgi:hypothetical protein